MGFLLVVPAVVSVVSGAGGEVARALPVGFDDQLVTSVSRPTAIEQLPNDRIVVLEQHTGRVRLIDTNTGALLPGNALDLNVCQANEQGLLGFTEDPQFASNGRVYVYYTAATPEGTCRNRVSAFTMIGDTINPATEQILIQMMIVRTNHNGGDVEVGNDGFLYIGVGDGGADPRGDSGAAGSNNAAQDLSILHGKVLRIDRFTGAPAPGNPFIDHAAGTDCRGNFLVLAAPGAVCREIWAFGLRNAYRFAFDPNTSDTRMFINDVGQSGGSQREEVNEGVAGGNFGWNICEGTCSVSGIINPLTEYGRSTGQFITAGAFVPNGSWPAEYDGAYLFADGGSGRAWVRHANGVVDYGDPFITGRFGIADMAFVLEPSGWALYYTQNGNGQVRKVTTSFPATGASGPLRFDRLPTTERVFDSRKLGDQAPIRGGQTRLIDLGPSAVGAEAALVNFAVIGSTGTSFATVWEPRTARPSTSNINSLQGEIVANSSIVPVDDQGRMLLYTRATADVIVDVTGFFRSAPGPVSSGRFVASAPTRVVDSRQPSGPGNVYTRGASGDGELVEVPIAGTAGVPTSGVDSVVVVLSGLAAPNELDSGWIAAYAGNTALPEASNLNVNPNGDVRVNTAVVPLGADGTIDLFLFNVDDVLVEVVGWFTDGTVAPATDGRFHLLPPTREVDTRNGIGFGPLPNGTAASTNPGSVPDGASAIAQNLTLAPSGGWGFITPHPGPEVPTVSAVNASLPGQTRAALAFTPLAADGTVRYFAGVPFSTAPHQLLVDAFGYFE